MPEPSIAAAAAAASAPKVSITGDTYTHREAIKAALTAGGVKPKDAWNSVTKTWMAPLHVADKLRHLPNLQFSDTPKAVEVTKALIRVFREAMRAYYEGKSIGGWKLSELISRILLPAPTEWEAMFSDSLVSELCRLDDIKWIGGRHPRHLASTNRKIYDMVFSTEIGRVLKLRNPNPKHGSNHSQHLNADARDYFRRQLEIVEAIARGSATKADFWIRMERQYAGGMLQLPFVS